MLVKIALLFLVLMGVLAVFGRLRVRGRRLPPGGRPPRPVAAPVICIRCGTPRVGPGDCPCGNPPAPKG